MHCGQDKHKECFEQLNNHHSNSGFRLLFKRMEKSELAKKWFKRMRLLLTNLIAKSRWDLGQECEPLALSVPPWRTKINNCYCISNFVDLGLSFLRLLKAPITCLSPFLDSIG